MEPVYIVIIAGAVLYNLNILFRGGGIYGRIRAMIRGTNTGFLVLMATAVTARYMIFISDKEYFLLPELLMVVIGLTLFRQIARMFPQL